MSSVSHASRLGQARAPFFYLSVDAAMPFSAVVIPAFESEAQERELARGTWTPVEPIVMRRNSYARRPSNFFYGGSPDVQVVSRAVADALTAIRATGWGTYPIVLLDEDGSSLGDDHVGLVVRGRCGPFMPLNPHVVGESLGVWVDETDWDGSDVFSPAGSTAALLTDRARCALAHLKGLWFVPFDEVPYFPPRNA